MTIYELPSNRPYQKRFRFLGWGAVVALLGVLLFSIDEPAGFSDSGSHAIAWFAAVIVLAAIVSVTALNVKERTWRLLRSVRFEISDGKLIRSDGESPSTEIPLDQIGNLQEYRGWLHVIGGNPKRQITIPKQINNFDALEQELTRHCNLTSPKSAYRSLPFLSIVLMLAVCFVLFTSHDRAVVTAAGVAALVVDGTGTYSLWQVLRGKKIPKLMLPALVFTWLLVGWIVYQRIVATP